MLVVGLFTPLALAVDVIVVPVSFTASFVMDLQVDGDDQRRAMDDLERARQFGMEDPERWSRMWLSANTPDSSAHGPMIRAAERSLALSH